MKRALFLFFMIFSSCGYRITAFVNVHPVIDKVVNLTQEQGVEVVLRRYVERHIEEYTSGKGQPLFITITISNIISTTELALEGTPMRGVRVRAELTVKDMCGRMIARKQFVDSWVYPAESLIVRTEVQFRRTVDRVLDRLAEKMVSWLASKISSGKIDSEETAGECSGNNLH